MASRPYWKGHIRLSLVSFPVELHTATNTGGRIHFHQIHRDTGKRIKLQKTVPEVGVVENDDIVKGYEVEKGSYITLEQDEIDELKVETKHTIDLNRFVDVHAIDPLYYDKPYYVLPEEGVAQEAFLVVRQALREAKKIALGQVVLSGREHLVAIQPCGKGMLLETLRTKDELKKGSALFADIEEGTIDDDQLGLARELIDRKAGRFDPGNFVDHYEAMLRELIEAKAEHREVRTEEAEEQGAEVIDLMDALKRSVGGGDDDAAPRKKTSGTKSRAKAKSSASKRKPAAKSDGKSKAAGTKRKSA
ncbi:non-homologous end joining protein Ku [Marinivivus vitaminiproducens]|uniref:non-homologous end joining protein Ku n=1 Tax=Marinivivus vitaminiproducens TaxID=3035935 RepID=UPI0027A2C55C|nr:Ku protein [Geminicoccaceae bacterium SCSIO 64248]